MAPPENILVEKNLKNDGSSLSGEEIVISGISGVFPNSDSVWEFMENLYNKVDMVSEIDTAKAKDLDTPKHVGRVNDMYSFDAQFFGVSSHLANALEPMGKKLLEHVYGAFFDAGISPQSMRGKRVGVFVGSSSTDESSSVLWNIQNKTDFAINGGSKAMLANRISYWIDSKGPSYALDYACSSSAASLEIAYNSIKNGYCESAIVGGCSLISELNLTLNMKRHGLLCLDGKTKCFDKNADGYVRADAINVIFLQKAKDAHRIYAEVYHAKGSYHLRPDAQFLPLRESEDIEKFLNECYSETDVDPEKIEYVEAHGAAIAKADENELNAIDHVFAKDSTVKVGSVKSNMGNSESASGLCSVTKLCLAYHRGQLPGNLHYEEPQNQIPAIQDGRIKIVDNNTEFDRGFTALNNFSFTGGNFHVVLKGHYKEKNCEKYKTSIPRLIFVSSREESFVQKILELMKSRPIDPEEIGLIHKNFENDIAGHTGRGYAILDTNENNETVTLAEGVDYYPGVKRPLWFVYSGMGSQWAGMGADLMRIPTFAAAIHKPATYAYATFYFSELGERNYKMCQFNPSEFEERCHKVLEPKGLDLLKIVTERDNKIFDNILNAFVGIGAIQIGLTDVIKELGIVPDYIIGHSLGEMACGYHDNTFTAEEMILSTYSRGKVCFDTELIKGSMAAVGIGYKAIINHVPPEIDVACHNSFESSTISGPADKMKEFVEKLTKQGIFAKEVPCANIAYHSRYIAHCGPELLRRLREVIKNPKKRSSKWISTSVPQHEWDEPNAVYSSAEYHTNNMLKPVLFEEIGQMIPDNAVVVEIAPHGLLQAILKRSHSKCTLIPLTRRGTNDCVKFLLDAIGKLYQAGLNPKVDVLYPKIEFPVSTETPLLSHFVEWEHSEIWPALCVENNEVRSATSRDIAMSVHDDDYKFLNGYIRDDLNVLPESTLLVLVWETLAMYMGVMLTEQSVIFRYIRFYSELIMQPEVPLKFTISINRGSNTFEVNQDDRRIVSGIVSGVKVMVFNKDEKSTKIDEQEIILTKKDVYRILESRGYSYKNKFQSIQSTNLNYSESFVQWDNNWITFLDSLIQLNILTKHNDGVGVSTLKSIRKLRINFGEHNVSPIVDVNGVDCYAAHYNKTIGVTRCAGVELVDVEFKDKPLVEKQPDVLLSKQFYPHYATNNVDLKTALLINLQIVAENTSMKSIRVTQIVTSNTNINCIIQEISDNIPNVNINVASVINVNTDLETMIIQNSDPDKANVFIIEDLLGNKNKLETLRNLSKDSFVLALENEVPKLQGLMKELFSVVSSMSDGKQILILLKRQNLKDVTYISVNCDNKLDWQSRVYDELNKTKRVVLVSERQPYCGALGFVQKLRNDGVENIGLVGVDDLHAPEFNANHTVYKNQLEKNLAINILKKGQWGGFYYRSVGNATVLRNVQLNSPSGDLDSLAWIEAPTTAASNNLVQVSYAGISLKDTQTAISQNGREEKLGMDFSGINIHGNRVMGLVPGGALGSTVEADPDMLWPVPEHWTLQDAATVPLPYSIAYYCVTIKCNLPAGSNVFIMGGAGALGQAAIAVLLSIDCNVFTTVGNVNKKKMLLRLFPKLNEKNICHERNDSFLPMITSQKKNACLLVINCTSGYLRETAMKCVGHQGIFLDLSKYDMYENKTFGMGFLNEDRSYKVVDFSSIFMAQNVHEKKTLQHLLAEGIAKGTVRPISRIEYSPTEVSKAFRLLSSSKHVGKVLIRMKSPEIMTQGLSVVPRMTYDSKGVYIVMCDETGLGIELADRLVKKGARKIMLHSTSKVSGYWHTKFLSWDKNNVLIKISADNLQTQQGCTKLLKDAANMGPVKGIFIVPDIENKKNETAQDFVQKFNKTANAVLNLDLMSKTHCDALSHFVIITLPTNSTSSEYTHSVLENIYQGRTERGFPALFVRSDALYTDKTLDPEVILHPKTLAVLFNGMDTCLKLKYNNVLFYNINKNTDDYLKKLANILGVADINKVHNYTIDEILNEVNLEELQTLIRKTYQIDLSTEKLQSMTVRRLTNIGDTQLNKSTETRSGLGTFINVIDNEEENLNTDPIVSMTTLLNQGSETEIDRTANCLTLIPGFEGRYQILNSVADRLKVQAVAVPLLSDMEGNDIPEMAATVRKFMKIKYETKSKFYLLGYSFGVNIALELAALLEKEGHVGVVYCLDSSPDALRIQLKSHLGDLSDKELQTVVLKHLYKLMSGEESEELNQYLEQTDEWADKVNTCIFKLKGLANFSNQYKLYLFNSMYKRILLAKDYKPEFKLQSEIVLIRSKTDPNVEGLAENYDLSKYSKQPVKVFYIDADHASAPYDTRVSNIVNKMLDSQLIEEYKKKNLCQTYFIKS